MCAPGMWGSAYGGYLGPPSLLLGLVVFFVLLAAVIWPMVRSLHRKTAPGMRHEPQPHDEPEPYAYTLPHEPSLEVLRERYARGEIDP